MTAAQTRRGFLKQAVSLPTVAAWGTTRGAMGTQVLWEPNCLSHESAQGFRSILCPQAALGRQAANADASATSKLIVLSGVGAVTREHAIKLRDRAVRGAWIVWESSPVNSISAAAQQQRRILAESFGISLAGPILLSPDNLHALGMYVHYSWPHVALTRTFLAILPIICAADEVIARCGDVAVAAKRQIGRGGIVLLGSMLGPNVRAGDREARQIAAEIFGCLSLAPLARQACFSALSNRNCRVFSV